MRKREKSMGKQERDVYGVEINTPPTCEAQAAGGGGRGNVVSVPENHLKTKIVLLRPDSATVHSALRGSGPRPGHSQDPPGCGLASLPLPPPPAHPSCTHLACSSGSFLCLCMWNMRSPPLTYSMTRNNLQDTQAGVTLVLRGPGRR